MKTMQIPDEMYDALINLANAYTTQEERFQAMPLCFSVREKRLAYGMKDDYVDSYHWIEDGEHIADDDLDLIDYFMDYYDESLPSNWDDLHKDEKIDYIKAYLDCEKVGYTHIETEKHMFLTRDACEAHIENNRHHYQNPFSYARTIWRNPQMELLANLLIHLGKK